MKVLKKLDEDGGLSVEQGNFYNPALLNREILPLKGSPPNQGPPKLAKETSLSTVSGKTNLPPFERTRIVTHVLDAVLKGNKEQGRSRGKFSIFPTSASEARFPQKLPKGK
jgi:hypothetical protein